MDRITQLLKLSLLEAVGDDPERAHKLRGAASAVAGRLADTERGAVPAAVLAAVEPGNQDSSMTALAEECLLDEWETLPNAFPETPRELLRAILLEAVAQAAADDADLRLAAWYELRSGLEQHGGGRWTSALQELLKEWDKPVRERTASVWQPRPASATLRMPSVNEPQGFNMKLRESLIQRARDYSTAASYQTFFNEVQANLATDVTSLISLAEGAGFHGAKLAHDQLRDALKDLGGKLRDAFELHERGLEAIRLRAELLWWLESRYSHTLECGYEDLGQPARVALTAALDVHRLVPAAAPAAVEHVLSRMVTSVTKGAEPVRIDDLANVAQGDLKVHYAQPATPATLLAVVDGAEADALAPALSAANGLPPQRAAVLLFRDLQAARALGGSRSA